MRRVLPGETGPSGGPALTDLLGVMESWSAAVTTVRAGSGVLVTIAINDIVSGKPVPARPSVRHRIMAKEAELRANATWPALETEPLGEWVLRASEGYSARANSALAVGDPGVEIDTAVGAVVDFYRGRGLPTWAQVVVGSEVQLDLESQGWVPARPGEADTVFQIASVAKASRSVRSSLPSVVPEVSMSTAVSPQWLAAGNRPVRPSSAAVRVLEGPEEVCFAAVTGASVIAKGRVARSRVVAEDWIGLTDIWVSPDHRRQRLALVVIGALLEWGAERGATTAYLQTRGDNASALALYDRLGFLAHHTYRYLTPPLSQGM